MEYHDDTFIKNIYLLDVVSNNHTCHLVIDHFDRVLDELLDNYTYTVDNSSKLH